MTANLKSALDIAWDAPSRQILLRQYAEVRAHSLDRAAPLSAEDQCVQSMPDVSPTKWHLAHTTWFFEAMLLRTFLSGYQPFDERYFYLFNSYYEALGPRHPRSQRGLLTRPSLNEIYEYRAYVDAAMQALIENCDDKHWRQVCSLGQLGLHHEQQHQELMLTDILHVLWCNPLRPAYQTGDIADLLLPARASAAPLVKWQQYHGGVTSIGHNAPVSEEFSFDNETPRHEVLLQPYQLADRLVSCGEYAEFIQDGGYRRPSLWLSDGWAAVQSQKLTSPEYWTKDADADDPNWQIFGLHGLQPMVPSAPVTNISFYEAAAYAEWTGARLPTEFEWENAATDTRMRQMAGYAWQWTRSSYDPYPGFRPSAGAVGEYNGKFMVGQLVLRGSSYATPGGHARPSYRNFFPPQARWQFSGLRLASDLK